LWVDLVIGYIAYNYFSKYLPTGRRAQYPIPFNNMLFLKKFFFPIFSLTTGVLLYASWPVSPFTFLIFFAFIPLLVVEDFSKRKIKFFGWCYLSFFTWNLLTTWWIWNASPEGAVLAIVLNSLLMCIPWMGFYSVKRRLGNGWGYAALFCFWLSFEWLHLQNWGLSWPWLTLGNVFATHPNWVQWYEWSGSSGGSAWVMGLNILIYLWLSGKRLSVRWNPSMMVFLAIMMPLLVSAILGGVKETTAKAQIVPGKTSSVVIVQPNVDPYLEKFTAGTQEAQIQKLIHLSEAQLDSSTALVVWPETAIPVQANEAKVDSNFFFRPIWDFLSRHPNLSLYTGIDGYRIFAPGEKVTSTARKDINSGVYFDAYNTAAIFQSSAKDQLYHKSRLVPGPETLPVWLNFLGKWFEDFGGISGTLAGQDERSVLQAKQGYKIAPAICYESIYGEFMTNYVRGGANVIGVITNDGWWGNTPGYRQHMSYSRLRAIETRRWVVRSANTGISCFIDQYGTVLDAQPWDKAASIRMNIPKLESKTIFVRFGDILSRMLLVAAFVILVYSYSKSWM